MSSPLAKMQRHRLEARALIMAGTVSICEKGITTLKNICTRRSTYSGEAYRPGTPESRTFSLLSLARNAPIHLDIVEIADRQAGIPKTQHAVVAQVGLVVGIVAHTHHAALDDQKFLYVQTGIRWIRSKMWSIGSTRAICLGRVNYRQKSL